MGGGEILSIVGQTPLNHQQLCVVTVIVMVMGIVIVIVIVTVIVTVIPNPDIYTGPKHAILKLLQADCID